MNVVSRHYPRASAVLTPAVHVIGRCGDGHLVSGVVPRIELRRHGVDAAVRAALGAEVASITDLIMIHVESAAIAARAEQSFADDLLRFGDARLWQLVVASDGS